MTVIRRSVLPLLFVVLFAPRAAAHPVPFSYLDVRAGHGVVDLTLVVHVFDVAYELKMDPAEPLLDPRQLQPRSRDIASLLRPRLTIALDGDAPRTIDWSDPLPVADRQSLRLHSRIGTTGAPATVAIAAALFPYDPQHQTFVNVYEDDALKLQAVLGRGRDRIEYFTGSRQGTAAVVRKFVIEGMHHILIGPDHLLFLVALLLLGGSMRRLALIVSAFTLAHSATLSLAVLGVLTPPSSIVEPAIALSIVCVGADNLTVRGGRDLRGWMAFTFGFVHGFGFASVLREVGLPPRALGWSLFSFNLGVEAGQLLVVFAVASALATLRAYSEAAGRRLAFAGSVAVIAAGAFWFVQRVFFPGGLA